MDLNKYLFTKTRYIEDCLDRHLPASTESPSILHEAMRYSVFSGGKRIRPILTIAAAETVGGKMSDALLTATAIEMIHTYSLVHDDLPSLDNEEYRRGRLCSHRKYGEAIAILVGDALLTLSFRLLMENFKLPSINKEKMVQVIDEIIDAAGSLGMIGGQVADVMEKEEEDFTASNLYYIHTHKTGALIRVAVRAGAILGGANQTELDHLTQYGENLGLAFQIIDDILDVEIEGLDIPKEHNENHIKVKLTYPAIYGLNKSKQIANELIDKAIANLADFSEKGIVLKEIAEYIRDRM
jgi:geranylgeranyl diphosphate synthase type II